MFPGTMMPKYITPVNVVLGAVGIAIIALALSSCQASCGKKREENAIVAGAVADTHAGELADLKQQLAGKETEIATLKAQGHTLIKKYEAAKAKIPVSPLPAPVGETALAQSLVEIGLGHDTQVQIGVPTIMSVADATVVFTLAQDAKRSVQLEEALVACDGALKASEAVQKAQEEGLKLSGEALRHSQAEAQARAIQAQELGRALKVEKAKGWQKYGMAAAAVVVTLMVKK